MDYKQRFSDRVENYIKYRPGYPDEIIPTLQLEIGLMADDIIADIGSGTGLSAKLFFIPLDTHLFRIARRMGFTRRKSADIRTALEVTAAFRRIRPDDPVRYDFSLTRLGIMPRPCATGWMPGPGRAGPARGSGGRPA